MVLTCKSVEQDEDEDFIKIDPTFDNSNEMLKVRILVILMKDIIFFGFTGMLIWQISIYEYIKNKINTYLLFIW